MRLNIYEKVRIYQMAETKQSPKVNKHYKT